MGNIVRLEKELEQLSYVLNCEASNAQMLWDHNGTCVVFKNRDWVWSLKITIMPMIDVQHNIIFQKFYWKKKLY